ncbi:MAG TPA: hypothetical protein VHB48_04610 [Chitinophagaceae bacterium]|jgi:antitoxin component YwqK of YwqJK toxin-antitoxin module|nr:hypothetical protein [Chitinophagaceae bacterium]
MMKKFLNPLLVIFVLTTLHAGAQKKDTSYVYFDSTLKVVPKKNAMCVEKIVRRDGLWYVWLTYIYKPYTIMTGTYKDRELQIGEGLFQYYINDTVIMRGNYHEGRQDGIWKKWTTSGLITDSVNFVNGIVQAEAKFQYHVNNHLWRFSLVTNDNEKTTRVYDTADVLISTARFKDGDGEMYFFYPGGRIKSHSVYKNSERILYEAFDEKGRRI